MAEIYDRQYNERHGRIYYAHICDRVIRALPPGGRLLDLGCGTGLFMQRYMKGEGKAIGLDISRGMILRARSRCKGGDATLATAEKLPFQDNSFDAVASLLAFSYLQKPEDMLGESFRVLKPGGIISICTLGQNIFTSFVPLIYRIGERMKIRRVGMAYFGEHYYSEDELRGLFEGIGFTDIRISRCSFAHLDSGPTLFNATKKIEPFIEKRMPYLAYNICISGQKP
jgi:ubiquinone/menaquinone biosynthesis C-methylase UbiE